MTRSMYGIPAGALTLAKEVLRHILRRPVVGICIVARDDSGRYLLVRRADTGEWALPGGTLEWGERLRACLVRELREEANAVPTSEPKLVGAYSEPSRDPRFHAVTIVAECRVQAPSPSSENPIEIREARFFAEEQLPQNLAFGMNEMLDVVRLGKPAHLE